MRRELAVLSVSICERNQFTIGNHRISAEYFAMLYLSVILAILAVSFKNLNADYVGAVVEHTVYQPVDGESNESALSKNIAIYEGFISLAAKYGVQVLVFPEFGLTPGPMNERADVYPFIEKIPDPSDNVLCSDASYADRPILQRISCAVQSAQRLVLINMIDNVPCDSATDSNCPSDGHYQYNTDVLFNEAGQVAAKYHKSHEFPSLKKAYDEYGVSEVTYKSSFGVEFGLFICYDIMFEDPPKVLRSKGITNFLYAVSQGNIGESTIIEPWSKHNNATVLSANLGSGDRKDCSGLIVGGKALSASKYYLEGDLKASFPDENMLVATIPN